MKKNVWIMNHYAGEAFEDRGGRHYNFARYLRRAGYAPVIFCSNAKHGPAETYFENNVLWQETAVEEIETPFVFVRSRVYTGNGKQRVLNMLDFYRNVQKAAVEYAAAHGKPDVICASSVHPLTLLAGIRLAKRFGVKCICEVRDLWPESIVVYSDRWTKDDLLIKLLYRGEKWLYKRADALVFTMEGGWDYITERGWDREIPKDKVFYINNGVDLEAFDRNREQFQTEDAELDDPELFKVVYTGAIRRVNHLGLLLDAAKQVDDPRVRFLIWGDGDERKALEQRVRGEGITNVVFKGRVEKKYIPSIVSRADVNFAHNEASPLFRFGISFNKLFDYLAAGKPVLMDFASRYNPAVQFGAGVSAESDLPKDTAAAVRELARLDGEAYRRLCANARQAAEEFDFQNLTGKLIGVIERV